MDSPNGHHNPARIVVSHLSKAFGSRTVVDDISFTVKPGEVTGFIGPNGAGKTTTLRMLVGLVTPTSGSATIAGAAYRDLPAPARMVGALLDATGFDPGRTGRDHLRVYAPAAGVGDQRVDEVLDLVGLGDAGTRRVRGYSLGMRQRLALATALLADPDVLICDEPTNGLDPDGILWLRALLREQAAQGKTVLVSSHLLAEMQQLVDSVVILHHGKIVYTGEINEIGNAVRVRTPDPAALVTALEPALPATGTIETSATGELLIRGVTTDVIGHAAAAAGIPVFEISTEGRDLEQIFLTATGSRKGVSA